MTELPVLPEGYFWRVGPREGYDERTSINPKCFGVSLRRKRLVGSRVLWWSDPATVETIPKAAQKVYNEWRNEEARRAAYKEVSGDYPPRKWRVDG